MVFRTYNVFYIGIYSQRKNVSLSLSMVPGSLCDQSWKLLYQPSSSGEAQEQLPLPLNNIIF